MAISTFLVLNNYFILKITFPIFFKRNISEFFKPRFLYFPSEKNIFLKKGYKFMLKEPCHGTQEYVSGFKIK
jgi:hypothetical protein